MGNALAALPFGIALEEFADLEEQHHEDGLGELGLCPREEADAEGTDGGNRHQEVLIEGIAVGDSLRSLLQRVVADDQIRYKIDKQQLPGGQRQRFLDEDGDE